MRHTSMTASILTAALLAFAAGNAFAAQHEGHHPDAAAPQAQSDPQAKPTEKDASGPGMKNGMKDGMKDSAKDGMMGGKMSGMMAKMEDREKQTSDLMAKLTDSMTAMENEKNAAALKQKMTDHRALLDQLQSLTSKPQCKMMDKMSGMMGNDAKSSAK
jgi:hypothetical protein